MLGGSYFRLTDCFACFLAAARCDKDVISVPFFKPNWLHGDPYPLVKTLFGLPSLFFVLEFQISRRWISATKTVEEQPWMDHVTNRYCDAIFLILVDRKSPKHYPGITLIDWFGKRGIQWHLRVATWRHCREFEMLTFAYILHSTPQDSSAVVAVMYDVISQLKIIMLELKTVYYRQDNAGCDHCDFTKVCSINLGLQ